MLRTGLTMDESNTLAGGGEGEDSVTSATLRLKHSTVSERGAGGNSIGGGSRVNQRIKRRSTVTDHKSDTERQVEDICMYVCMYVYMYICMYVVCMLYVCMYVCMYVVCLYP